MPNDAPDLIDVLAGIVRRELGGDGMRRRAGVVTVGACCSVSARFG